MAKREPRWKRKYDYDYMAGSVYKPPNYRAELSERMPGYVFGGMIVIGVAWAAVCWMLGS